MLDPKPGDERGLCGEFGISEPIGYDEVSPGGYFPKIGVGLLKKVDNSGYSFARHYDVIPFVTDIDTQTDCVTFAARPAECNGYLFQYRKKVSLADSEIIIDYCLENNGEKAISTTEYCHNFIRIDQMPVSSGYLLSLPFCCTIGNKPPQVQVQGNQIGFSELEPDRILYFHIEGMQDTGLKNWTLYHRQCGVGITERDNFMACRFSLWAASHVISPETFIRLELEPGQSRSWQRKYQFFTKQPAAGLVESPAALL